MALSMISPQNTQSLVAQGAILVDVREPHEFAGEHIEGAINMPLSTIAGKTVGKAGETIIFLCKSGARTTMAAKQLEQASKGKTMVMSGGLMAWKLQGLPTSVQKRESQGLLAALAARFRTGR